MSKLFPKGFGFGLDKNYLRDGVDAVSARLAANPQLAEDAYLAAEELMSEGAKPWPPTPKPVEAPVSASGTPPRTEPGQLIVDGEVIPDVGDYIDAEGFLWRDGLPGFLFDERPRSNIR